LFLIILSIGNVSSFDESVETYFGHDATDVGIYSLMTGKQEHSRRLLAYNLTQRLLKSHLPIIIEAQPRLFGEKYTPAMSMYECVKRLQGGSTRKHHIIADICYCQIHQGVD
jgi:hypothetical protein